MPEHMVRKEYVKVKKGILEDCLTCPLCFNLLREATTICVCLHTFCKQCILQKFEDDEANCCPMCNVFLGYHPKEKLRPDNNLQDLRMKVFSLKKSKELESMCTPMTFTRRKERSLSSIVVRAKPRVMKLGTIRKKAVPQKSGVPQEHNDRDVIEENGRLDPIASEWSNKFSLSSKKQCISGDGEPSQIVGTTTEPPTHPEASFNEKDKGSDWERLTVLAETANRTNNLNMPLLCLPASKSLNNDNLKSKNKKKGKRRAREPISDQSNNNVKGENGIVPGERTKFNSDDVVKVIDLTDRSVAASTENGYPYKEMKRLYPVWFTLLASKDVKGDPYPQIPECYIRIKDRNLPVSYINRYLAQKLNLRHESEVEVMCCGQTLFPDATLNNLVDMWIQYACNIDGPIRENNSNRNNFVMVLTYRRK